LIFDSKSIGANKKHLALNTIYAATLWSIWKSRNTLIFDSKTWISLKQVLTMIPLVDGRQHATTFSGGRPRVAWPRLPPRGGGPF
jgi:hypothetical protein